MPFPQTGNNRNGFTLMNGYKEEVLGLRKQTAQRPTKYSKTVTQDPYATSGTSDVARDRDPQKQTAQTFVE
jgi:hypothetical protein